MTVQVSVNPVQFERAEPPLEPLPEPPFGLPSLPASNLRVLARRRRPTLITDFNAKYHSVATTSPLTPNASQAYRTSRLRI